MNCKKTRLIIDEMIDGQATDMDPVVFGHIKSCKKCSDYRDFWISSINFAPVKVPGGLAERIMEKVFLEKMKTFGSFSIVHFFKYAMVSAVTASLMVFVFVRFYTTQTTIPVTFKIAHENAATIALAGDFNDWQSDKILLKRKGDVWEATVRLKPNRYQYMFVIDGEKFVPDPESNMYVDDGFGRKNSVIDITGV